MPNSPDRVFDVAVIGGGIAGAAIVRDAALRGMNAVLFEKDTFGSGTSSKSSKLIHGGIRYLDLAWRALKRGDFREAWKNFRFVFVSLRECRILATIAPDLVKPIALLIPIYKRKGGRNPAAVYAGTLLYSLLAIFTGYFRFPVLLFTPRAVLKRMPKLEPQDLAGGVIIWDHWTRDQELVRRTLASATRHGALAFERARVLSYRRDNEKDQYEIRVDMGGSERAFYSRWMVNASGPWVDQVREAAGERKEDFILPIAGAHIMLKKFLDYSVILQTEDGRIFFVINIDETARVGTTERLARDPDRAEASPDEVAYLLSSLHSYFPSLSFRKEDILAQDAGVRPLARPRGKRDPHLVSREHEIRVGPTGVLHVLGVKLTDHRRAAEEILNRIAPVLRGKVRTHRVPLSE
jgi:glycerol-3-phosphate dehydrogenase